MKFICSVCFALQSFACSSIRKLVRSLIGLCVCCVIRA